MVLFRLFKLFHKKQDQASVALSLLLGVLIALTPSNLVVDGIVLGMSWFLGLPFIGIGLGTLLGIGLYSFLDPLLLRIGEFFLINMSSLEGFWVFLLTIPGVFLFQLNNTLMLGSLIFMAATGYPVFLVLKVFVYKTHVYATRLVIFKPLRVALNALSLALKVPTLSTKDKS